MKLKIENLQIKLKENGQEIISEANLEMSAGEIILISGSNGSGKSSFLSAIFKHPQYVIDAGKIILENKNIQEINESIDLTDLKTFEIAKQGLYLSLQQVPEIEGVNLLQFLYRAYKNLNSKSLNNNLDKNLECDLSILDFNKRLLEFCQKYKINSDFLQRDLNVGMSGGEKKQAEMLHLLALKPKFIFMDEPDSGVDKEAIQKVFAVIQDLQKDFQIGFCLVSHSQNLDKYIKVDKVYEMQNKILKLKF